MTILPRFSSQPRYGHLVAAFLPLSSNLSIGPPHEWMEPEQALGEGLEGVDRRIATKNMAQFMGQHVPSMRAVPDLQEVGRHVNAAAQKTPYKGLADLVDDPDGRHGPSAGNREQGLRLLPYRIGQGPAPRMEPVSAPQGSQQVHRQIQTCARDPSDPGAEPQVQRPARAVLHARRFHLLDPARFHDGRWP